VSYSRWSNSVWYTYSDVNGGFTVCGEKNFTDIELKDIPKCLSFFDGKGYSPEEISELRGYMEDYVEDEMLKRKMETHSGD
jgi:hypothetical protein